VQHHVRDALLLLLLLPLLHSFDLETKNGGTVSHNSTSSQVSSEETACLPGALVHRLLILSSIRSRMHMHGVLSGLQHLPSPLQDCKGSVATFQPTVLCPRPRSTSCQQCRRTTLSTRIWAVVPPFLSWLTILFPTNNWRFPSYTCRKRLEGGVGTSETRLARTEGSNHVPDELFKARSHLVLPIR
jgi:hypothetical protein